MLAPIGLTYYCYLTGTPYIHWEPLTLVSGGMFHMSMGAILGVAAWTRGVEKHKWVDNYYDDEDSDPPRSRYERETMSSRPINRPGKGGIDNSDEPLE